MPQVNLTQKPAVELLVNGAKQITEGDTHGNTMRVLYSLIRAGICDISDEGYNELVAIYKRFENRYVRLEDGQIRRLKGKFDRNDPTEDIIDLFDTYQTNFRNARGSNCSDAQIRADIEKFQARINQIQIKDPENLEICYRMIGDILADRAPNDILTLLLLEKMHQLGVNYRILYSNHDSWFVRAFFDGALEGTNNSSSALREAIPYYQGRSLFGLRYLIKQGIVPFERIQRIVNSAYLPKLLLCDYSKPSEAAGGALTVYTHAPATKEHIAELKTELLRGRVPNLGLSRLMMDTIHQINGYFHSLVMSRTLQTMSVHTNRESNAVNQFVWRRTSDMTPEQDTRNNHQTRIFVHGHDFDISNGQVHVIDNEIGKGSLEHLALGESDVEDCIYETTDTVCAPLCAPEPRHRNEAIATVHSEQATVRRDDLPRRSSAVSAAAHPSVTGPSEDISRIRRETATPPPVEVTGRETVRATATRTTEVEPPPAVPKTVTKSKSAAPLPVPSHKNSVDWSFVLKCVGTAFAGSAIVIATVALALTMPYLFIAASAALGIGIVGFFASNCFSSPDKKLPEGSPKKMDESAVLV